MRVHAVCRLRAVIILLLGSCISGCSSNPTGPSRGDTAIIPLAVQCPAGVVTESLDGAPVRATYPLPAVEPSVPGLETTCSPAPGSEFPIGTTTINCQTAKQNLTCSFSLEVLPPPRLSRTRFVAFGDSITEGFLSLLEDFLTAAPSFAYPTRLELLMNARYLSQSPRVINAGRGGETSAEGRSRLPGVLDAEHPDVLLLLEGINEIRDRSPDAIAGDLESMVREAQSRGVGVLIATLTPVSDSRENGRPGTRDAIDSVNRRIFDLAADTGIDPPVDLFSAFEGDRNLLGNDGLHPSEEGYQKMAEEFLEAIKTRFEQPR